MSDKAGGTERTSNQTDPADASKGRPLVVLGLGNTLMADDGIGVHLLREVQVRWQQRCDPALADRVEFIDAGVAGLGILNILERADVVVAVDAAELRADPGRARWLRSEQLRLESAGRWSLHAAGFAETLRMSALLGALPEVYIFAVQPADLMAREGLSEPLKAALPGLARQLLKRIAELARQLGCR